MATVNYITPIMDRTLDDVAEARSHQNDLVNKYKGAWNYVDCNRVCNNLLYAAQHMYEVEFFDEPLVFNIKTDWTEEDIITRDQLNNMIVGPLNELYSYSRPDLDWRPISSIANMNYVVANDLEYDIDLLAHQIPMPPEEYTLTVKNGTGSGIYVARTVVNIKASQPPEGQMFSHWVGDHLENIGNPTAASTTYEMPHQDVELTAVYTSATPHTITVVTHSGTFTGTATMGSEIDIEADPAPTDKVFYKWIVEPAQYEDNLYEPAATTTFTMPNEAVTLTAFYITRRA